MAQSTYTKEEFWAGLEKLGEEEVRTRLVTKGYGDAGDKRALVQQWLDKKTREHDSDAIQEQIRISRSSRNAAWAAAVAAVIAAVCAILTIMISF